MAFFEEITPGVTCFVELPEWEDLAPFGVQMRVFGGFWTLTDLHAFWTHQSDPSLPDTRVRTAQEPAITVIETSKYLQGTQGYSQSFPSTPKPSGRQNRKRGFEVSTDTLAEFATAFQFEVDHIVFYTRTDPDRAEIVPFCKKAPAAIWRAFLNTLRLVDGHTKTKKSLGYYGAS